MGVECIGNVDDEVTAQAVSLAIQSLALTGKEYVLEVSHMGFVTGLLDAVGAPEAIRPQLFTCIQNKNWHDLQELAVNAGLSKQGIDALCKLGGCPVHGRRFWRMRKFWLLTLLWERLCLSFAPCVRRFRDRRSI